MVANVKGRLLRLGRHYRNQQDQETNRNYLHGRLLADDQSVIDVSFLNSQNRRLVDKYDVAPRRQDEQQRKRQKSADDRELYIESQTRRENAR
jgi:hypothetical protein